MNEVATKELPENWAQGQIKDLVMIRNGYAFKSKDFKDEGGVPVIRQTNLSSRVVNFNKPKYLPVEYLEEFESYKINNGDVLIGLSGSIGNLSRYLLDEPALQNQRTGLLVEHVPGSIKYVEYYLQLIKEQLLVAAKGVAVQNISSKTIEGWDIPIAPPEQQKRIVAKIEELFSHIGAGIEALKKAKQLLKQYRQSVLKAAVTGELTKEWREANKAKLEPASQLLERILKERRQKWEVQQLELFKARGKIPKDDKWKEKYKEPYGVYEEIGKLPDEWCWAAVDQLGEVQLGRQRSPKNRSKDYPTKYIRAANITEKGLNFTDLMDMEFKPDEFERYVMKANDLVLSEASGSPDQVGKPAIWRKDMPDCCFQNTVIRHRPYEVNPEYLLVHYKYFYWCQIFSKTAGGVGINHLSAQKFLKMSIALPSELEQQEIIYRVEDRFDAIARLNEEINVQLIKVEKNKQSILASAFSGRLNEVGRQLYGAS